MRCTRFMNRSEGLSEATSLISFSRMSSNLVNSLSQCLTFSAKVSVGSKDVSDYNSRTCNVAKKRKQKRIKINLSKSTKINERNQYKGNPHISRINISNVERDEKHIKGLVSIKLQYKELVGNPNILRINISNVEREKKHIKGLLSIKF